MRDKFTTGCTECGTPMRTEGATCLRCTGKKEAAKRNATVKKAKEETLVAIRTRQILEAASKFDDAAKICEKMIYDCHGGLEDFCREYYTHVQQMLSKSPGSNAALNYFRDMIKLQMEVAGHSPKDRLELDNMNLDDIEREIDSVARRYGFKVVPGQDADPAGEADGEDEDDGYDDPATKPEVA